MAKRKEIAAEIRQDAPPRGPGQPLPQMLRLMESLDYDSDEATVAEGRPRWLVRMCKR